MQRMNFWACGATVNSYVPSCCCFFSIPTTFFSPFFPFSFFFFLSLFFPSFFPKAQFFVADATGRGRAPAVIVAGTTTQNRTHTHSISFFFFSFSLFFTRPNFSSLTRRGRGRVYYIKKDFTRITSKNQDFTRITSIFTKSRFYSIFYETL